MQFNNVIETLRVRCSQLTARYGMEYQTERLRTGKSLYYYRYRLTSEKAYQLATLMDREFADYDHFLRTVRDLVPVHPDPVLSGMPDGEAADHANAAQAAFLQCLEEIAPDCPRTEIPYFRNLTGAEAEHLMERFRSVWGYVPNNYWYPLNGGADEDKLYLPAECMEPYLPQINRLLGIPGNHIYEYGESWYPGIPACSEIEEIIGYCGCEAAYTDKDFQWMIYFSHEDTVTFAGSIVPQIKEILMPEREYWNRWPD